jgi:activator of HSP90 ATPase
MKAKTLRQSVIIPAMPQQVYEALMDSKLHAAFTGDTAKISREVGGKISAWGGYISGKNLSLVANKKIVQEWRASDWPKGVISKATFNLAKAGSGTKLTFVQVGLPADQYEEIKQGWIDYYWKPLKDYFKK